MSNNLETKEFKAEVQQLLNIVINSLYTDKKIFLRELISNAADALEKMRYLMVTNEKIKDPELPLEISITTDDTANTITVYDTGIGMTKEELTENLGTIAHSGSKAFIKRLAEGKEKDINLIGQFGVGFYSVFMAAKKVIMYTRSYKPNAKGCIWISDGSGEYTIEEAKELDRGTKIVVHLREDAQEFAQAEKVKETIKQFSNFVPFPIKVNGERVNTIEALWTKSKSNITEESYNEFYRYIANAYDEPMFTIHFSADAPININTLLFIPQENIELYGFGRMEPGVNLYSSKVLIQENSQDILPDWLRFIKGVVDSEELPLNISRETTQDTVLIAKLRKVLTGRIIKFLKEKAEKENEKYKEFWNKFGNFIKEGIATDADRKEDLVDLLRFESSKAEAGHLISLKEYTERMKEEQEAVYYINGPSREAVENGPYLEIFKEKDIEVIFTFDTLDDYVLTHLGEYNGKKLLSADQADIDLAEEKTEAEMDALTKEEIEGLTDWIKNILGEKVIEVRESKRLINSPAVILSPEGMTHTMQRMFQSLDRETNIPIQSIFEINASHPIIKKINQLRLKNDLFAETAVNQIFDTALISAGLQFDHKSMVERIYDVLDRALER